MHRLAILVLLLSFILDCLSFQVQRPSFQRLSTDTFARGKSKWDDLKDDDEDENVYDSTPIAPDMTYEPRNLMRQSKSFQAIREVGGKDTVNDIYIHEPGTDTFWFIGKIARADVSLEKAVARQWPMIERHGCNLRPIELMPHWGKLQLWAAPGDSELEVAYNRPSCEFQKMEREVEGAKAVKSSFLGFQGEAYEKDEYGFRTARNDDGTPARPELTGPGIKDLAELEKMSE
ncbi:unnamed protein product [Cylindrotheca closterium]|uniref:SURF1-like protein n=1 Tax=Cylindrotheca closterium TaxID=2856 RepID=A0AAD2FS54_9STRA|nr:unnamed protein product [Cylindrotheca closterium]